MTNKDLSIIILSNGAKNDKYMGKKLYYTLVILIALITAAIFYVASVINLPEQFAIERSALPPWVFIGIVASVIVVILAGIADRQKDKE